MVQASVSMTDDPWFDSWKRKDIFPSPKFQDLPSRPIFKVCRGELGGGGGTKWSKCGDDHLQLSGMTLRIRGLTPPLAHTPSRLGDLLSIAT